MSLEMGQIYEGKVTGITKFGAFVELADGTVGMVHISEVSNTYVEDISKHLAMNQQVKVKVTKIGEDGKIAFSIKKALPKEPREFGENNNRERRDNNNFSRQPRPFNKNGGGNRGNGGNRNPSGNRNNSFNKKEPQNFEDMLSKFMTSSADKFSEMKSPAEQQRRRGGKHKSGKDDYENY